MFDNSHWLNGSAFVSHLKSAIDSAVSEVCDGLDDRKLIDQEEEKLSYNLFSTLTQHLRTLQEAIKSNPGKRQDFSATRPELATFDLSTIDLQGKHDIHGADFAFLFRANWGNEFVSKRGILVQAKRINAPRKEQIRLLKDQYGDISDPAFRFPTLQIMETLSQAGLPMRSDFVTAQVLRNGRHVGEYTIDTDQLTQLLEVVSSYYLFFDNPISHRTIPCVQALTVKGLCDAKPGKTRTLNRASVLRHAISLSHLLVNELVGCRIGEWNDKFQSLERIAISDSVAPYDGTIVTPYSVRYLVDLDITVANPYPN
jgi:hypothetical protein